MKHTIAALAALIIGLGTVVAGDNENSKWAPDSVSIDAGLYTKTTDFEDDRGGASLGLNAFWTENIGLGLEVRAADRQGRALDETWANLLFRNPVNEHFSFGFYAGAGKDWENRETLINAGLRIDQKLYGPVGIYAKAGWEKALDRDIDHAAVGSVGLNLGF